MGAVDGENPLAADLRVEMPSRLQMAKSCLVKSCLVKRVRIFRARIVGACQGRSGGLPDGRGDSSVHFKMSQLCQTYR